LIHDPIEMRVHDIPVDWVVTPQGVTKLPRHFPRPDGISWELLPPEKIEAIPVLKALLQTRGQARCPTG
jgi:5-formyltetrahydrofolate cyclo-ligase